MPKKSRQKKGHQNEFKPDVFQKHAGSFLHALTSSGEKMLYLFLAAAVILVVLAWVLISVRTGRSEELLNELSRCRQEGDLEKMDSLLAENRSKIEAAVYILERANASFSAAQAAEDAETSAADIKQADRFYNMFIQNFPAHELAFAAHHGLGCVMEQSGRPEDALSQFRLALNKAPENMKDKFSYDVGRLLKSLGKNDEARVFLSEAARNSKVIVQHPRSGRVFPAEAGTPIATALLPPEGDYAWRLNARQLLAELEDEAGREKVKALLPDESAPEPSANAGQKIEKAEATGEAEQEGAEPENAAPDNPPEDAGAPSPPLQPDKDTSAGQPEETG